MAEAAGSASVETAPERQPVYTRPYILLWCSELVLFASFYVMLAVFPLYILELGGTATQVGVLLAIAGIVQLIASPICGRAVDVYGRKPMSLFGMATSAVVTAAFILTRSVWLFSLPLMARSVTNSAAMAASRTLVLDLTPPSRRGEAISMFTVSANVAIAFAPPLGLAIFHRWGADATFLLGAAMCVIGFFLVLPIKAPAIPAPRASAGWRDWVVPEIALPAVVALLLTASYVPTFQFLALVGEERGIVGYQVFFTVYAAAIISVRLITGRVSDRYGRAAVLLPALTMQALSLFLLAGASSLPVLVVSAVGFGMGWGAAYPMLLAIAGDRVIPSRRGAALGVMGAMYAMGHSVGVLSVGYIADVVSFGWAYTFTGGLVLVGLAIAVVAMRRSGELRLGPVQAG